MSILVTGAAGQLGAELCRLLAAEAVGVDIDTLDLTDRAAVLETLRRLAPRAVIHCAAYTQVDQAETDAARCRAVNVTAVETLAAGCRELDCPLVQISTDYVFAGSPGIGRPWREDDPPLPKGVYAVTKFEGEQAAAAWPKHLIVRTCGLYARPSHTTGRNFVKTILRLARTQPKLRVVDDQWCTPSYVPHVARAIVYLLGTDGASAGAVGDLQRDESRRDDLVRFRPRDRASGGPRRAGRADHHGRFWGSGARPAYSVLDTTAYHRLGGPPMPDWKEALGEYFAELKQMRTN